MRLYELFESPFTQPGISYILNDPQDTPAAGQNGVNNQTVSTAPNANSGIQTQGQTSKVSPVPAMSAAGGSQTANTAAPAIIQQQLTKGSTINIPTGPNQQPTQMKVTNTSTNDIVSGKTTTLTNPQKPNQPAQTYNTNDLATIMGNKAQK